jgi:ABC-type polar amino acid transport system ATPase subunit
MSQRSRSSKKIASLPNFDLSTGIRNLLILAGPSASGKTTFARAVYHGSLSADILALLPPDITRAPSVDVK